MKEADDRGVRALDVVALCRAGGVEGRTLAGELALRDLGRLVSSLEGVADDGRAVRWSARFHTAQPHAASPQWWLELHADATVLLQCQRCLQPLPTTLVVDRRIRFVDGEDEAARLDEESDDDVLALPPRLDLPALVEDELILALPLVPRHDGDCPVPLPASTAIESDDATPAHPFAALAAWRRPDDRGPAGGSGRSDV